ncbi:unnamed protein product, partial [Prorocentrum cordatum]
DLGLVSQSFGQGAERRISLFRVAPGDDGLAAVEGAAEDAAPEEEGAPRVDVLAAAAGADSACSGVVLCEESREALLEAVRHLVPPGWCTSEAFRVCVCRGLLRDPRPRAG